jgi:hypothetical protein
MWWMMLELQKSFVAVLEVHPSDMAPHAFEFPSVFHQSRSWEPSLAMQLLHLLSYFPCFVDVVSLVG